MKKLPKLTRRDIKEFKRCYRDNTAVQMLAKEVERLWKEEKVKPAKPEHVGYIIYLWTIARCAADNKVPYREVRRMAKNFLNQVIEG